MKNRCLSVLYSVLFSALCSLPLLSQSFATLSDAVNATVSALDQATSDQYHNCLNIAVAQSFDKYMDSTTVPDPPPPAPYVKIDPIDPGFSMMIHPKYYPPRWNVFDNAFAAAKDSMKHHGSRLFYTMKAAPYKVFKHLVLPPGKVFYSVEIYYVEIPVVLSKNRTFTISAMVHFLNDQYYILKPLYPGLGLWN